MFNEVASLVFAFVGGAHVMRAYMGAELKVGKFQIPERASYIAAIVLMTLACWGISSG